MPYVTRERDTQGIEGPVGSSLYGVCHTDSDIALKVVDLSDFDKLIPGVTIHVKFAHTNTAIDPLMDVNGTGILPLVSYGDYRPGLTPASSWNDDSIITLTYDGNAWVINGYSNADSQFIVDNELSDTSVNPVQNRVIKQALDTFSGVLHYRGTKPTVASLPSSGNIRGDVWLVEEDDSEYIWNGSRWEQFGPTIDLSSYATIEYVDNEIIDNRLDILSYGHSTWSDFISAYTTNRIVYCRASSNSDPSSGSQTRMAFMAYVNNAANPTEVEFQYYRSVSSHTASQQGDQVFVYKLTSSNGGTWTVTTREASSKIITGTGLESSYSNGALTLTANVTGVKGDSESSYRTGNVNITKANIGLGNVDNTSDANKPVSTAQQAALDLKVDKVSGKGLSTEDYTTAEKDKLANIDVNGLATKTYAQNASFMYGECNDSANISNKSVVVMTGDFALKNGSRIIVNFQNANTANSPKINVNGTGSKNIRTTKGVIASGDEKSLLTGLVEFVYSETYDQYYIIATSSPVQGVKGNSESSYRIGNVNITKANIGLENVDNTSDANKPISTAQQAALDLKAPLASPALTGTPTAPTPTSGSSNNQIATKGYVDSAIPAPTQPVYIIDYDTYVPTGQFSVAEALWRICNDIETASSTQGVVSDAHVLLIKRNVVINSLRTDYIYFQMTSRAHIQYNSTQSTDKYEFIGWIGYENGVEMQDHQYENLYAKFEIVRNTTERGQGQSDVTYSVTTPTMYYISSSDYVHDNIPQIYTGYIDVGETSVNVRYSGTYIASSVKAHSSSSGYSAGEIVSTDILLSGDQTGPYATFTINEAAVVRLDIIVVSVG